MCEGYTDVMAFALAGAPNAVATCGTALTDEHVRALKNLAARVVLAYDADAAGQGAAEKWYEWEAEYDIECGWPRSRRPGPRRRVPGVTRQRSCVPSRKPRRSSSSVSIGCWPRPISHARGQRQGGAGRGAIVAEHPNELVRDQYVMQLAAGCDIEARRCARR